MGKHETKGTGKPAGDQIKDDLEAWKPYQEHLRKKVTHRKPKKIVVEDPEEAEFFYNTSSLPPEFRHLLKS